MTEVVTHPPAPACAVEGDAAALVPHILTLAARASDQLLNLAMALDTRISLDDEWVPPVEADILEIAPPHAQRILLQQTLNDELRRQLQVLSLTTEALYDCADKVAASTA